MRTGHALAMYVLALLTIGVVMVNSAGMVVDPKDTLAISDIWLSRSTVYAGIAVGAMILAAWLPIRRLSALAQSQTAPKEIKGFWFSPKWIRGMFVEYLRLWPLWLCVLVMVATLVSVYVPGIQRPRNGSHRWITLHVPGLDSIQPSELAKWGMVLIIAWYGARYAKRMKSFWLGLIPGLVASGLVAACIVKEDLGTGALIAMTAVVMLLAAGGRIWQMLILGPLPLAGVALAIITSPYRMHRIESFMNPYLDPQGKGFHMIQSMVAVANGRGVGRGLGHGLQKFGYLPEDTTDFLFAVVCEELGIAGATLVLFLMAALVWTIASVVRKERDPMMKLIALGVMSTVGIQAIINLCVVTGLGPTKGIALPLMSSGGTGWILTAAAIGLVISIDRSQRLATPVTEASSRPTSNPSVVLGSSVLALGLASTPTLAESDHTDHPSETDDRWALIEATNEPKPPSVHDEPVIEVLPAAALVLESAPAKAIVHPNPDAAQDMTTGEFFFDMNKQNPD